MRREAGQLRLSASDVANFLACRHVTHLDLLRARGLLEVPQAFDIGFQDLVARGEVHEANVLATFRSEGMSVLEIPDDLTDVEAADATRVALTDAIEDVIFQGVLLGSAGDGDPGEPSRYGRPDFLVRAGLVAGLVPSAVGSTSGGGPAGSSYEVIDAKLARSAKARAVLQSAFYSALLAETQRETPRLMHLALGSGDFSTFRVGDFAAYERQTRRLLRDVVTAAGDESAPPSDPYPEPVEHCTICRWATTCSARRRADDDLSLVAGMPTRQRQRLKAVAIPTRRGLAAADPLPVIAGSQESLRTAQLQARLQVSSEDEGQIRYELLAPDRDADSQLIRNRGLLALPEPDPGDLFFDIEGARYWSEDGREFGLQYLFGIVDTAEIGADGRPRYHQIWSFDRAGEGRAFEELIDFITERQRRHPRLHVFHYNHYEPTSVDHLTELHGTREEAVGHLMGRFATREGDVDELFRHNVFVDLYRVVRQSLRAGVESYSIKRLEPLCGYDRQIDLHTATEHLIAFESSLDEGTAASDVGHREIVAGYNEDDCRATLALRDWLEGRRHDLAVGLAEELPRPVDDAPAGEVEDSDTSLLRAALLDGVPVDDAARTSEQRARVLTADLLEWHRREAKPAWWRHFHLQTLTPAELADEPDAIGMLTGGEVIGEVARSLLRRFGFPAQEHRLSAGDDAIDPATNKRWKIQELDDERGIVVLKIGQKSQAALPQALIGCGPPESKMLAARLLDLGRSLLRDGEEGHGAVGALLLRRRPAGDGRASGPLQRDGEVSADAALRWAMELDASYLPIQGPPGTGKTYLGAMQILQLVAAGRTVGITASSHAVICNLVDEVLRQAADAGAAPRVGQRIDRDHPHRHAETQSLEYDQLDQALRDGKLDVVAGTQWLWAREEFQDSVDTLIVDEAGQMSLANVLAIAGAARNVVLLGDPQQLAQPSQAAHPPGAGVSALEHLLGDHATMPAEVGLLLERTWRMHPEICAYTSEIFYDGRLSCVPGLENQALIAVGSLAGAGIRIVSVVHEGNTNSSPQEAQAVAGIVVSLLAGDWRDQHETVAPISADDVLVVTPYNAQIRAIEDELSRLDVTGVRVGTVDKFQGREAPAVIYSMATSSADEAPRGMEFLYDLHRLNVATSRARAVAVVVASPDLIRVFCRTPRQMVLANALCRAFELDA